jgi:hypothetical protein
MVSLSNPDTIEVRNSITLVDIFAEHLLYWLLINKP